MAELLTTVSDDKERRPVYMTEGRQKGIKIIAPDDNESF